MIINEKGLKNSYLQKHLWGKDISLDLILRVLAEGTEETPRMGTYAKPGSRYFKLDLQDGVGLPGRFVLPEEDGTNGGQIANWNCECKLKFRHGKLSPILRKADLPDWLIQYASNCWVILEKNQTEDGRLQLADGPTESDPEGSWMVATAHYGPPSRMKPRLPKPGADAAALLKYLDQLDSWSREQDRVVFVDLEDDGHKGLPETTTDIVKDLNCALDSVTELLNSVRVMMEEVQTANKQ